MNKLTLIALTLITAPAFASDAELDCKLSYNFTSLRTGEKAYTENKTRDFSLTVVDKISDSASERKPSIVKLTKSIGMEINAYNRKEALEVNVEFGGDQTEGGMSFEFEALSASSAFYFDSDSTYVDGKILTFDVECEAAEDEESLDEENN